VNTRHTGLTSAEARERLDRHGRNVLPSEPRPGVLEIALRQLRSPLVYVLLAAAVAAFALGDYTDAGFIGVVLLLNSSIGGWQEWRAEQQSHALQRLLRIRATVLRDGRAVEIDAEGEIGPLTKFLHQLNTSKQLLRVEKLRFGSNKKGEKTLKASMLVTRVLLL